MNYNSLLKGFCFYLLLFISGCTTYNQSIHSFATEKLNKLTPHYVSTPQGQIEYYRCGRGSPIILIPGYATDISSWNREFLATLAQHHQIFVPNNRNVGGSKTSSTLYRTDDLANDMYRMIQELKLKKPTVIGISMGGMIAQKLAVLHPDTLGHLVLINTSIAGKKTVRPAPKIQEKLLNLPKNKLGFYLTAIDLFFPPKWKMSMAYSLIADRFQPKIYTEINRELIMPQQKRLILNWLNDNSSAQKIKKLQIPVLILNGESDIVIPLVNSNILANSIPHAQLIRWKEGGHAMIYQYPEEIGNEINKFIAMSRAKRRIS